MFCWEVHNRLLRPLLAADQPPAPLPVRQALKVLDRAITDYIDRARIAAEDLAQVQTPSDQGSLEPACPPYGPRRAGSTSDLPSSLSGEVEPIDATELGRLRTVALDWEPEISALVGLAGLRVHPAT